MRCLACSGAAAVASWCLFGGAVRVVVRVPLKSSMQDLLFGAGLGWFGSD